MKIDSLYWKGHLEEKILWKHGVTRDEVEELIYEGAPEVRSCGKQRYCFFGQTQDGRYLFVVVEKEDERVWVPITGRDMTTSEKHAYKRRLGRK